MTTSSIQEAGFVSPDRESGRRTPKPRRARSGGDRMAGEGFFSRFTLVLVLIALVAVFSVLRPETFPTYTNLTSILSSQTVLLVLAVGAMFPLIAGEFDLSVGFMLGFTAMFFAVATTQWSLPFGLAIPLVILVGAVLGTVNAILILKFGINAFIATLASGTVLQGLTLWLSAGRVVAGVPAEITAIGRAQVAGMPILVFFAAAIAVAAWFVLDRTRTGRLLYATGLGREAARLAGVKTSKLLAGSFVVSGVMASLAGMMQTANLGAANPDVGAQYLLPVFAAAFLGATAIRPGRFNVLGTVLSLLLLAFGISGLSQLGAPLWVSSVFNGLALIVAVAIAVRRRRAVTRG
ncbi:MULTISPECIES: ABC transporter permease [unclassified Microbacterium]|uniref:ABC transporter permease n=1 Tax=unclassified Microbacterium TaxID=2609290 RepID=UPI0012FDA90E|nr:MULTISPECIES: ABC transporter permease [unclassified Microbacterium]